MGERLRRSRSLVCSCCYDESSYLTGADGRNRRRRVTVAGWALQTFQGFYENSSAEKLRGRIDLIIVLALGKDGHYHCTSGMIRARNDAIRDLNGWRRVPAGGASVARRGVIAADAAAGTEKQKGPRSG